MESHCVGNQKVSLFAEVKLQHRHSFANFQTLWLGWQKTGTKAWHALHCIFLGQQSFFGSGGHTMLKFQFMFKK